MADPFKAWQLNELTGLLEVPLNAWVVALDEGVLRVRFLLDDMMRGKLQELNAKLSAAG